MTIRLIKSATVDRYERAIEALKRDLAHVSVHRDLVQERLDQRDKEIRRQQEEIRLLKIENERWMELLHAFLFGDDGDEPRKETIQ